MHIHQDSLCQFRTSPSSIFDMNSWGLPEIYSDTELQTTNWSVGASLHALYCPRRQTPGKNRIVCWCRWLRTMMCSSINSGPRRSVPTTTFSLSRPAPSLPFGLTEREHTGSLTTYLRLSKKNKDDDTYLQDLIVYPFTHQTRPNQLAPLEAIACTFGWVRSQPPPGKAHIKNFDTNFPKRTCQAGRLVGITLGAHMSMNVLQQWLCVIRKKKRASQKLTKSHMFNSWNSWNDEMHGWHIWMIWATSD